MLTKKKRLEIYKTLSIIRDVQNQIINRYHPADKMRCPMHFCIGQELLPAALSLLIDKNDSIFSHHRSHGFYIAKKGSIKKMIAEFYGKVTGTNGGLAGSQELSSADINFYSGTILSGAFAMALGDAYSKLYLKNKNIAIAVIGDGGMEEGICFETLNMASKMKLPILFLCENNSYSTHTHLRERVLNYKVSTKVKSFSMSTTYFNGNDPEKLFVLLENIIKKMRNNKKPHFFEINTYRFNGHVGPEGDDHFHYRSEKERNLWIKKDPLKYYEKKLTKNYNDFQLLKKRISKSNNDLINSAFKFAEKSKFPRTFKDKNFIGTYKNVKNFFNNNITFGTTQEGHKPKPY
jgi:pyruvate dehydrogenase E1 component alpha subunit